MRQLGSSAPINDRKEFYTRVVKSPCSRFWVSEMRAAVVISLMLRGKCPDDMLPEKRRMYEAIYSRVTEIMKGREDMCLSHAVEEAVWSPAPEFYMAPETARKVIRRMQRQTKERRRR